MRMLWCCFFCIIWITACSPARFTTNSPNRSEDGVEIETRNLDTLVVTPDHNETYSGIQNNLPLYHNTEQRKIDILHTQLDLRFNWTQETVIGKAVLHVKPYFYPIDHFALDAVGFKIKEISFADWPTPPDFNYDGEKIHFQLSEPLQNHDTILLTVEYEAYPSEGMEGSRAITSDKGLFFINPRLEIPGKPQQIWTQGETEFNSKWFPTIDKPNERTTQETIITVLDKFQTLSNGLLYKSVQNPDGTRTDYWRMDQPHAPYLFMVAIGEFAIVEETWKQIPVQYYVEKQYEADAKDIFANTLEMLSFFSEITGIDYPWSKYAQVVVEDYVSGAMENTTSVIFGDFVQKHQRELIDQGNDGIVAHELFHHWFGNYVTCESWSNLTLNEGFANYSEYLWFEHKYGVDEADHHRKQELQGYLYEASNRTHPLIHFSYDDKENMFDQHSYNKGGLVLHMLRNHVGDLAFFSALHNYLTEHAFQAVEVHDLRLAFEKTTGEDLNWFFNQWFLASGHPILNVSHRWEEESSKLTLVVEQIQDPEHALPIYRLPTEVAVVYNDNHLHPIPIDINQRKQIFEFVLPEQPLLVVMDPEDDLLGVIQQNFSQQDYQKMYQTIPALTYREDAIRLMNFGASSEDVQIAAQALADPYWSVRSKAISKINWSKANPMLLKLLSRIASSDPHSAVRSEAILTLSELDDANYTPVFLAGINKQDAYPVVAASLLALYQVNPNACLEQILMLEDETNDEVVATIAMIYGSENNPSFLPYFEKHLSSVDGYAGLDFYEEFEILLTGMDINQQMPWLKKCESVALNPATSIIARLGATRTIINIFKTGQGKSSKLSNGFTERLNTIIQNIIKQEKNLQLKNMYQALLTS